MSGFFQAPAAEDAIRILIWRKTLQKKRSVWDDPGHGEFFRFRQLQRIRISNQGYSNQGYPNQGYPNPNYRDQGTFQPNTPAAAGQTVCPKCGASVPAGAKFCLSCGEKLASNASFCPNCGKPLPPGAKFCSECGSKVQ